MDLFVPYETYKRFAEDYPHISKEELEYFLKRSKRFTDYDYWNHFMTSEIKKPNDFCMLGEISRSVYAFFTDPEDILLKDAPSIIELVPNADGILYWYVEGSNQGGA